MVPSALASSRGTNPSSFGLEEHDLGHSILLFPTAGEIIFMPISACSSLQPKCFWGREIHCSVIPPMILEKVSKFSWKKPTGISWFQAYGIISVCQTEEVRCELKWIYTCWWSCDGNADMQVRIIQILLFSSQELQPSKENAFLLFHFPSCTHC